VGAPWISVVVPVFNEERAVAGTVQALVSALEAHDGAFEVLVVDNASTDGTRERLAALASESVRVLVNDRNRGKGHSVRRGMLEARGALRLHCDADCAVSLPSLPAMLELARGADLVVGSRLAEGAAVGRRQPLHRRIVGRTFVGLCRRVLGEPVRDLYCGFKLWRAEAAVESFSRLVTRDWLFDAEAIAMARALGFRVAEVGIVWSDREGSRLSMPRVLAPALRDLARARRNVARCARRAPVPPALAVAEPTDRRP
jgi:dolichyl-phosphate beta-glucosyltransferase